MKLLCCLLVMACFALTPVTHAGITSPTLLLSAASGIAAGGGRAVTVEGAFDFPNAVQVGYPLNLVVFQGTRFVRYPVVGGPVAGTSATLADGVLADTELTSLLQDGATVAGSTRIITLAPSQIRVALPSTFTAGATRAVLFTVLADGPVVSNPIDFTLP